MTQPMTKREASDKWVWRCLLIATWGFVILAVLALGLAFFQIPWAFLVFIAGTLWFSGWFLGARAMAGRNRQ